MSTDFGEVAANHTSAFDGRIPFGQRPALVIVDVVMAYLDPAPSLYAEAE